MRRLLTALAFGLTGPALALGGCTFLITFDDAPARESGTSSSSSGSTSSSGSSSFGSSSFGSSSFGSSSFGSSGSTSGTTSSGFPGTSSGSTSGTAPPCDSSRLNEIVGCDTFIPGAQVCASSQSFSSYPFTNSRSTDLVTCNDPNATCVKHCQACIGMPMGVPDECDLCAGKPDGTYCGREMPGWSTKNGNIKIECSGGRFRETGLELCGSTCTIGGTLGRSFCAN